MRDGWQRRRPAAGDHHDRCRRVPADGVRSSATSRSSARSWPNGATTSRVCRNNYVQAGLTEHRGVRLRRLPTAGIKHLNAIVHSGRATSVSVALASWFDLLHNHALDPGVVGALPRYLSPAKVVLTVHGLNDQCAEWGRGAGTCYGRPAGGAGSRMRPSWSPTTWSGIYRQRRGSRPSVSPPPAAAVLTDHRQHPPAAGRGSSFTNDCVRSLQARAAEDHRMRLVASCTSPSRRSCMRTRPHWSSRPSGRSRCPPRPRAVAYWPGVAATTEDVCRWVSTAGHHGRGMPSARR